MVKDEKIKAALAALTKPDAIERFNVLVVTAGQLRARGYTVPAEFADDDVVTGMAHRKAVR